MHRLSIAALCAMAVWLCACSGRPSAGTEQAGQLHFCLKAEPKTLHPLQVAEDSALTLARLTGGVLLRKNRATLAMEPEMADRFTVREPGRIIRFHLRPGMKFSDGTPFTAEDVAYTLSQVTDEQVDSPLADQFRSGNRPVTASVLSPQEVDVAFAEPVADLTGRFDSLPILSSRSALKEKATLGAFYLAEQKPGQSLLLLKNPYYSFQDAQSGPVPHLSSIRMDIQQNRDLETIRFQRGELHLMNNVDPERFDQMAAQTPAAAKDLGPSLDTEFLWFNQKPDAPLPGYKKDWFRSAAFRRSISAAIQREDLAKVAYRGHATPAASRLSPANHAWTDSTLKPHTYDLESARQRLSQAGFRWEEGVLKDRSGHAVSFSLITQAGNAARERMATMIQQDLARLGVQVSVVPLDFRSLLDRITKSSDYDACLLGQVLTSPDPDELLPMWLSSGVMHAWNPHQSKPATAWESEVDRLASEQNKQTDPAARRRIVERLQRIFWEEAPEIYLVHRNALVMLSPQVKHAQPVALWPQVLWNVERLSL